MESVAILAGGQATRFGGRDKSALLLNGRTIRERQMKAIAPLTEPAAARLADRRLTMRDLVDRVRTRAVPVATIRRFGDPDRLLSNVSTPAGDASLETLQGHKL